MAILPDNKLSYRTLIELFLAEMVLFFGLWFWNPFIAKVLSVVMVLICIGILVVSLISELLEKSNVPDFYFKAMAVSIFSPLLVALVMIYIGGESWEL